MKFVLENAGKKFYSEWIFRNLDFELSVPGTLAILGPNGSGKSTLLQVISGSMIPTEGSISYYNDEIKFEAEEIFRQVSFASPYLELIEEFTLREIIHFHFRFKKSVNNISENEIIQLTGLDHAKDKSFRFFSSGMKQRVKLTLALLSDVKMILLDEPCSNLDEEGMKWYRKMIEEYSLHKMVVICSNNHLPEFDFCDRRINLSDWKNKK